MNGFDLVATRPDGVVHLRRVRDGAELWLVGTAHISQQSVDQVRQTIEEVRPDTVIVELDERRLKSLENSRSFQEMNIIRIVREGQTAFVIATLLLQIIQRRMSAATGVRPGAELLEAVHAGRVINARVEVADRDIGVTLRRAWRLMRWRERAALLGAMLDSEPAGAPTEADLEALRSRDALTQLLQEMAGYAPTVKRVLLDERDRYMVYGIQARAGQRTVAVVGAGHLPGIVQQLPVPVAGEQIEPLTQVPPFPLWWRSLPWVGFGAAIAFTAYEALTVGLEGLRQAALWWIAATGGLSALGTLLALAHPLSILAAFLAAPLTTLIPVLGAGVVVGLVQAVLVPPRVADLETATDQADSLRGWYSNRLLRVLLVAAGSSLGASAGTFVALPAVINLFAG